MYFTRIIICIVAFSLIWFVYSLMLAKCNLLVFYVVSVNFCCFLKIKNAYFLLFLLYLHWVRSTYLYLILNNDQSSLF